MNRLLSPTQLARYECDGFLALPGFVDDEDCLLLRERVLALALRHVLPARGFAA